MKERYQRQIVLPEFDKNTQEKISKAKVLVVGAGALGSSCLLYLTAAGIGKIGIVDGDKVEISNLHRQILYKESDCGKSKSKCAKKVLSKRNSNIHFKIYNELLENKNARKIISKYDIVVDCTDNFPTRYLINDACYFENKANVHASILGFEGQLSVFNLKTDNGNSANYRDLYPSPPNALEVKSCEEAGVIGALPGILGSMQALEVLKIVGGFGEPLKEKLFKINTLNYKSVLISYPKNPENPISGKNPSLKTLINYHQFCGTNNTKMKTKTVQELKEMMTNEEVFQLIDVREPHEYDEGNINGYLIPLGEVPARFEEFRKDMPVVVQCRSGVRSANAITWLEEEHGFENLYNLEGGILAWVNKFGEPIN